LYKSHIKNTKILLRALCAQTFIARFMSVAAFLEMLTKSAVTRATTATRAGCVQHGLCHITPFSGRGSRNAAEDPGPDTETSPESHQ